MNKRYWGLLPVIVCLMVAAGVVIYHNHKNVKQVPLFNQADFNKVNFIDSWETSEKK